MTNTSEHFHVDAVTALTSAHLQKALQRTTSTLQERRAQAYDSFPGFEQLRDAGSAIKDHCLSHLDHYLTTFEQAATQSGSKVLWAVDDQQTCQLVLDLCQRHQVQLTTKVKSMLSEEVGLPQALDNAGIDRVETDLAEHINQLCGDAPSHIVIPAMHKTREEVSELFAEHHCHHRHIEEIPELVQSAREHLRDSYFSADLSISGANFLIAETGSVCIVSNEGNAELTIESPRVQIVLASIEKLVAHQQHCTTMLRLLARSALGMELTQYTTFINGPRRQDEKTGPDHMYIILVDNKRSAMLSSDTRDILKCIRCAACINHCPVYRHVGGHAYGGSYQGPMGSILNPALDQLKRARDLPQACTLNGRCQQVCPVKIPLPHLLRRLREQAWREKITSGIPRYSVIIWTFFAQRSKLYQFILRPTLLLLAYWPCGNTRTTKLPFMGNWTQHRDLPRFPSTTFIHQYYKKKHK